MSFVTDSSRYPLPVCDWPIKTVRCRNDHHRRERASASASPQCNTAVIRLVRGSTFPCAVTVISKNHHHVLSSHRIDPDRNYWPDQTKNPGRWPGNL